MKKRSLLIGALGTLGTTAAWYIFSNKKLRQELAKAKTPEDTAKILMKHLGRDSKKIASEVHQLVQSGELNEALEKARKFSCQKLSLAKSGFDGWRDKSKKLEGAEADGAKEKAESKAA